MVTDQEAEALLRSSEALLASLASEGVIAPDATACLNTAPIAHSPNFEHAFSPTMISGVHSPHSAFGHFPSSTAFTLPSSLSPAALGLSFPPLTPVVEVAAMVPPINLLVATTASSPQFGISSEPQTRTTSSGRGRRDSTPSATVSPHSNHSPTPAAGASPAVSSAAGDDDELELMKQQLAQSRSRTKELEEKYTENTRVSSPITPSTGASGVRRGRPPRGSIPVSAARLDATPMTHKEITEMQENIYALQANVPLMKQIANIMRRSSTESVLSIQNKAENQKAVVDLLKLPPAAAREVQDLVRKEKAKVDQRAARAAKKEKKALAASLPREMSPRLGAKRGRKPKVESTAWLQAVTSTPMQSQGYATLVPAESPAQRSFMAMRSRGPAVQSFQSPAKRTALVGANGLPTPSTTTSHYHQMSFTFDDAVPMPYCHVQ